ncbi:MULTISPECIES: hypothetical protein [Polyangium]|uniref:Uncharacterized protein n=2 Tax=Polyangium TaxID=55 RepID=A0A4U1J7W4_9BACT|nr:MULTISPECIES: hypothetical protein [Polyangium]MDI1430220.1 hypothetical protein [Polyangium sorediatum]TKD03453.1 hypothetical protein E8A74_26175 [Polyangium fumosum]
MAKKQTQRGEPAPSTSPEEKESEELTTELALGSDGLVYVNAEHLSAEQCEGRRMFQGYALTPEEAKCAANAMHKIAFNITAEVRRTNPKSKGKR